MIQVPLDYLPRMTWLADLQYFEGPLLSHMRGDDGSAFLVHWCDCTQESVHRWLVVRTTDRMVYRLLAGQCALREVLITASSDLLFLLDKDSSGSVRDAWIVRPHEIQPDYLPGEGLQLLPELVPAEIREHPWSKHECITCGSIAHLEYQPGAELPVGSIVECSICGEAWIHGEEDE